MTYCNDASAGVNVFFAALIFTVRVTALGRLSSQRNHTPQSRTIIVTANAIITSRRLLAIKSPTAEASAATRQAADTAVGLAG
jgi:hypothetical protein